MKRADYVWGCALIGYAAFIWIRDLQWTDAADDVLPILAGLPLFVWLKWPIRFAPAAQARVSVPKILAASVLFAAGILTNTTLALTISWTILLWCWIATRWEHGS